MKNSVKKRKKIIWNAVKKEMSRKEREQRKERKK
jgi:hypothetical protein